MMFTDLLAPWQPHRGLTTPPAEPILLWRDMARSVWVAGWGPLIPYGPVDHHDGNRNHRYRRLKGNAGAVQAIPEAKDWLELEALLLALNDEKSPVETVGCEKAFSRLDNAGNAAVMLGSYVEVIFSEIGLNEHPENLLWLSSHLLEAVKGSETWWGDVEMVLEIFKGVPGTRSRPWGLMIRVSNAGRNEEEARKFSGITLKRLGDAVLKLPQEFRFRATNIEPELNG